MPPSRWRLWVLALVTVLVLAGCSRMAGGPGGDSASNAAPTSAVVDSTHGASSEPSTSRPPEQTSGSRPRVTTPPRDGVTRVTVSPADRLLDVLNNLMIAIQVEVNGQDLGIVPAGVRMGFDAEEMTALPWSIAVRTLGGRALSEATFFDGDVYTDVDSTGDVVQAGGDYVVEDLSCGRLEYWSGAQGNGPYPGPEPGAPGDCDP